MAQAPDVNALAAVMEKLGIPSSQIGRLMADPIARQQLAQLGTPSSGFDIPELDKDGDVLKKLMEDAMQAYELEKSRPHRKPQPPSRFGVVASLNAECEGIVRADQASGDVHFYTSFLGLPKSFSSKPLDELERIEIGEMLVSKTQLLCRIVSRPNLKVAVSFGVEDPAGRTENFSIYNFPLHGIRTGPDLDALFPLGTILVVREPTFKMNQNNTGPLIRVDSPTDISFVSSDDPLVSSIRWSFPNPGRSVSQDFDYKALGNSYFKSKKYLLAIKAYTDGLQSTSWLEQRLLLHLNRSQAHLMIGNFNQAHQDASQVLSLLLEDGIDAPPQSEEKALLRLSRALGGLRRFSLAFESYEKLLAVCPDSKEAKSSCARIKKVLDHSSTGMYDWLEFARAKEIATRSKLLVGDFCGPIEVKDQPVRGGGRGLFAVKDIKPGELLLGKHKFLFCRFPGAVKVLTLHFLPQVETALAVGQATSGKQKVVMAFDLRDRSVVHGDRLNLIENLVAKTMDDSSALSDLYGLYGDSFPPSSTPALKSQESSAATGPTNLDIARIEAIASTNCFGGSVASKETGGGSQKSTGLFIKASLFNHSCAPSATWSIYDNVIVIRARTSIAAGTVAIERRRKLVNDQFSSLETRLASSSAPSPSHSRLLQQLERLITDVEKTYSTSRPERYRVDLSRPLLVLSESLDFANSGTTRRRSVELAIRSFLVRDGTISLEGGGAKVPRVPIEVGGSSVSTLLICARRFAFRNDPTENETALKWIKAAMDLEKMTSGGGYPVFRFKHDTLIRSLGIEHLVDILRP
ncbi:hypothetical protein JCM5350_007805 [Sporobolomyces pararoseus]